MVEVNSSLYLKKKSKLNLVLNIIIAIIVIALFAEIIFASSYSGIYVIDSSMKDTLIGATSETAAGGDYVYVNMRAKPDYGDIVVVTKSDGTSIIKRVVAFGGDRVKLVQGKLWLQRAGTDDFEPIPEDYVSPENNNPAAEKNNFHAEDGYRVEEDSLFLLGDNRNVSIDSRENGGKSFPMSSLYGVVTGWSLKHKAFFTAIHKYFYFDLPRSFGLK